MRIILTHMDLDDVLLGVIQMPLNLIDEQNRRMDRKALLNIYLHPSNEILQNVQKEKTTAGQWLMLEQLCMTKSLTNKLHLKQCLYSH